MPSIVLKIPKTPFPVRNALPAGEKRRLTTSIVLTSVADGTWGVDSAVSRLPELAKAAGYAHLQHLVNAA